MRPPQRGRENKAQRGEWFATVPIGYLKLPTGEVVLEPDEQARAVVQLIFDKFQELGTARGVCRYLIRHNIRLGLPPETSEQLDWRPSTLFVTVHVRKKYVRKQQLPESGLTLSEQNVVVAKKPPEAIPGSLAGPGLMAQVIVSKGADHLPLYRLEGIFKRQGVRISRQAMDYTLSNWAALSIYPEDGWLDIDNNEGENSLRGLCLGRRNWLFCGSDRGGRAAAIHFSLLASCKRQGHDPWVYLRDVLTRLPALLPASDPETLLPLLPHRWKPT